MKFLFISLILLFLACSSHRDFEPQGMIEKINPESKLSSEILRSNKSGAVLKNDKLILKNTATSFVVNEGEDLISFDEKNLILNNSCKELLVIPYENNVLKRDETKIINTNSCATSATKKNNLLAGVLGNNTAFIYDLNSDKFIYQESGNPIFAISSFNENPVFDGNLVIFPMLDGRLNIYDLDSKIVKNSILVGVQKFFNNIIYLNVQNGNIVASTRNRLYSSFNNNTYTKNMRLRDVNLNNNFIYALTIEGNILKLDRTLATIKDIKLPFAILSGIILHDNKLYTLEKQGYLVEVDINTFDYKIFKTNLIINNGLFYDKNFFYAGERYLDLSKDKWRK